MRQKEPARPRPRTELSELRRQVVEKDARIASLLDACPDGIIVLDHEGRVAHANAAAAGILGIPASALTGLSFADHPWNFSTPQDEPFAGGEPAFLRRIRAGEAFHDEEFAVRRGDGSRVVVSMRSASGAGEAGRPAATALHLIDLTAPTGAGRQPAGGDLESFALLVGGIGNDFNNILTAILGNTSLAKIDVNPRDEIYRTLTYVEKAAMRARDLAERLLDLARRGTGRPRVESLGALVNEAVEITLGEAAGGADVRIPAGLPPVDADSRQIKQALTLALRHAARVARGSHPVAVSIEKTGVPPKAASRQARGIYLKVAIRAPGHAAGDGPDDQSAAPPDGIPPALDAARLILDYHGGILELETGPAGSLCLNLYLPAVEAPAAAREEPGHEIIRGAGRILVMDDEEMVRDIAGKMLGRLGYTPAFAVDGAEALKLYKEALGSGRKFDAVLMDLTVPGGMDGREATAEILKLDPAARIIISTGYSTDPILADFSRNGFQGAVCKPYEITKLGRAIHAAIGAKKA